MAGRVLTQDGRPRQDISVVLSRPDGSQVGRKTVGYDGSFVFDTLTSGEYLLTIERPDLATVGRPLEIRDYKEPRTVVLDIRLKGNESASFREVVKAYGSLPSDRKAEEKSKKVSRKAGQAYLKGLGGRCQGRPGQGHPAPAEGRAGATRILRGPLQPGGPLPGAGTVGECHPGLPEGHRTSAAIRPGPTSIWGSSTTNQGKLDQAIQRYRQALAYDPSFAEAHQALGEARFQQGRHYAAEQHLETATRLAPARAAPSFGLLVKIQLLNKDPNQAQFYLNQFLQHHPDAPIAPTLQKEIDTMLAAGPGGP